MPYFKKLTELLQQEYKEDKAQYLALSQQASLADRRSAGLVWYPLAIRGQELDRADYLTIELERTSAPSATDQMRSGMPARFFSNHDKEQHYIEGVIKHVNGSRLKLNLKTDELPDWAHEGKLGIELLFDDKSYDEMFAALASAAKILASDKTSPQQQLLQVLLGHVAALSIPATIQYQSGHLNSTQQQAIHNILAAQQLAIVHGPPGTGKTTTLVAAIKALAAAQPKPILVVAPSNTAVDLLSEKLHDAGLNVMRIGNPSRISDKLLALTLEGKLQNHAGTKEAKKLKKQAAEYKNMAHKYKRSFGRAEREQRKALFDEAYKLLRQVEIEENYNASKLFAQAQVITATLVGSNHYSLPLLDYQAVVIDEAGQALEPACYIPILKAPKLILAGDYCQLPPTIKNPEAAKAGLSQTLLEKTIASQPQAVSFLNTQYRMHEAIMQYSNQVFYGAQLQAHPSIGQRLLYPTDQPLCFIDTAGCAYHEQLDGTSTTNPQEAQLLIHYLGQYLQNPALQHKTPNIAIISPYKKQIDILKEKALQMPDFQAHKASISINTIDSFQGQERDIVCISLCRSNSRADIGFLADIRRMNVAMTRARHKLIIIGDSATLASHPFYSRFIDHCQAQNSYISAWEII
jgi:ATP-dependent RNA/DNA helicase IGHMBP2